MLLVCAAIAFVFTSSTIAGAAPQVADDWSAPRHDAANTGYTAAEVRPPLKLIWRVATHLHTDRNGFANVILATREVVAIGTPPPYGDTVSAETRLFSPAGRLLWSIPGATPLFLHGDVVLLGETPRPPALPSLGCYDWRSHRLLWRSVLASPDPHAGFPAACAVVGGLVYLVAPTEEGHTEVRALALTTGQMVRAAGLAEQLIRPALAVAGNRMVIGSGHRLSVYTLDDFKPHQWFYDGGDTWPIICGDLVVALGWSMDVQAMDVPADRLLWRMSAYRDVAHCLARDSHGRLLIVEDLGVGPGADPVLPRTGAIVSKRPLLITNYSYPTGYAALLAGSGRFVYVPGAHSTAHGGVRGGFYCLLAEDGQPHWSYQRKGVTGSAIAASSGRVYGLDTVANLYCFAHRRR